MSTYYPGPALDSELAYRRSGLRRAATEHRLARSAHSAHSARSARTGRRSPDGTRPAH